MAVSHDLPFGRLASPGAGMLPMLVIGLMILFGLILVLQCGRKPAARGGFLARSAARGEGHGGGCRRSLALHDAGFHPSPWRCCFSRWSMVVERARLLAALAFSIPIPIATYIAFDTPAQDPAGSGDCSGSDPPWKPHSTCCCSGSRLRCSPDVLWYAFLGCLVGTLVGMLPGIGPLAGISILLPVTFGLEPTKAIVMLAGIYYGSQYGGSTTAILMRIPGEAASVMTCIDGYAMAQKGRAGAALCIAAVGSFVAGTLGVIALTVVAPPLANFALRFGPPEYTALLVLGLIFLAYMSSTSLVRTLLMASVGLLLGTIGIDVMTGHFRYSFDIKELGDGIGIVPVAVGLFGLGEILQKPAKM